MARRRHDSGNSVSLFPFLSILVCIIGCLTLIIVVINLIAMNRGEGRTDEEVERAREFLQVKKDKQEKQKELDDLRQLIENLIQENRQSLQSRKKLASLKEMLENREKIEESRQELIAQYNLLRETNKKLNEDEKHLREEIKKKEEELAKRKKPPEPAELRVRPSGSSTNTRPFFAEISERGVYIHRSLSGDPEPIPVSSLNQSEDFIKLLETVAEEPYNTLIFLVRGNPGAVKTLQKASGIVSTYNRNQGTEIIPGRLPLPGEGEIDLQMFDQFLKP